MELPKSLLDGIWKWSKLCIHGGVVNYSFRSRYASDQRRNYNLFNISSYFSSGIRRSIQISRKWYLFTDSVSILSKKQYITQECPQQPYEIENRIIRKKKPSTTLWYSRVSPAAFRTSTIKREGATSKTFEIQMNDVTPYTKLNY